MSKPKPSLCPDFDLAELVSFDPNKLIPKQNDQYERDLFSFMLGLALIFNDFKGLEWWLRQLEEGKASDFKEINSYNGQWHGFHAHIVRLSVGIFHEFIQLIENHLSLIGNPKFLLLIKPLPRRSRKTWNEIVDIAQNWEKSVPQLGTLKGLLHKIRSKVAYHYDVESLQRGYEEHFKSGGTYAQRAYVSLGDNLGNTRFFYADAAGQKAMLRELDLKGIPHVQIQKYREMMNEPIKHVLELFLRSLGIESRG